MAKMFAFAHDENKEDLKLQRNQWNERQVTDGEFALKFSM